jgi:6-phosphogluconolactonase (cycloisomerase 2 family)
MRKSAVYTIVNPDGKTGGKGDPSVGGFQSHALVAGKGRLYAVNPGDGTVSSLAIHDDGSLQRLCTVSSGGTRPVSLAVCGGLLYVANEGAPPGTMPALPANYTGFHINHDGRLAPIAGSTVAIKDGDSPGEILFNHNGKRLIACRLGGNVIDSFDVDEAGRLVNASSIKQPGPFGAIFHPVRHNSFMVALANPDAGPPGVVALDLAGKGAPTVINAAINPAQMDPCWLAITQDGRHLWASAFIPMSLTLYSVSPNGSLTEVSQNLPSPGPNGSTDIALDSDDRFLYRLRVFDVASGGQVPQVPIIEVLQVTGTTAEGGLHLVQALALDYDPGLSTAGVMGLVVADLG